MGQNDHLFKYIDKDKMFPFIDENERIYKNKTNPDGFDRGYITAMILIKHMAETGMWDWQQGS